MEQLDLPDGSKDLGRKKVTEQDDDDSICSEKKVELQDDDSFEVISISCDESSKYSASGESEEDDALVISISQNMNKSFPKIQLLSDLIESNPSSITLTAENDITNDTLNSPEADLTPEVKCKSSSDISSQDNLLSSIMLVSELSEIDHPDLNVENLSPPSLVLEDQQPGSQLHLGEGENALNFHGDNISVISSTADVFEKYASDWTVFSSVNMNEMHPNTSAVRTSPERENFHTYNSLQKPYSSFTGEQFQNGSQLFLSSPNIQTTGLCVGNSDDTKELPVKKDISVSQLPKVKNSATGIWGWLCPKNLLHSLMDKAWASVDAMINTLDPQMKHSKGVKPDFEVLIATTYDSEALPIQKAFRKTFLGKAATAHLSVTLGCIPLQPVGFQSALYCAEKRIKFMREHKLVDKNKIIVATSPVLVEVTPLRWHYTVCIMLDDPHLELTLHTFTQTVPVPNIYVNQVKLRTPSNYHLKCLGFSITVGRVISIMTGMPERDWQHTMTGTSSNKILESAAVVLAGMYKSYLNGISY